jgi:hypothetical protein
VRNPTYHSKTKHIDVQYHFFTDMVEEKKVFLMKVDTLENVVDSLRKYASTEKFSWCRESMGISTLDCWSWKHVTPIWKKTTSGIMLGMSYILYMIGSHKFFFWGGFNRQIYWEVFHLLWFSGSRNFIPCFFYSS